MHLETKNPRDDGGHPAGVNQSNLGGIRSLNIAETQSFLKEKLQRRFRVSPGYACVLIELAHFGGLPR